MLMLNLGDLTSMPRYLQYANLIEGREAAYIHEHDNIYMEVSSGLKKAGVQNLHIWRKDGTNEIFMYIEIDGGKDIATALGENSEYLVRFRD